MKHFTLIITILFSATFLSAKTITVTSSADSGAGTLREAVTNADNGDVIVFAENITTVYFAGVIIINKKITINGNETNNTIFQDGTWTDTANKKRFFDILENAELTLNHLTMKDHIGNCTGGAIVNNGNLTLNNCTFSNNRAYDGAGAILDIGNLIVMNCIFSNNVAPTSTGGAICCSGEATIINSHFAKNYGANNGGAVYVNRNAIVSILNCFFEENTSQSAGAISNWGTANIDNCTFKKNKVTQGGGAIENHQFNGNVGLMNISNSTFYQNEGNRGIFCNGAEATIINCLFYKNITNIYAIIMSDGYANSPGALTLINSTIADNTGSGLYNSNNSNANRIGYATLQNNIFSNNTKSYYDVDVYAENVSVTNITAYNNLIGTSNIDLSGNNNIIDEDPLFVGDGDYSLQAESPAIDKGNNAYLPAEITKDILGNIRICNTVDMGAYEYQNQCESSLNNTLANKEKVVFGFYDIIGRKLPKEPTSGLFIILYNDGSAEKVIKTLQY